MANLPPAVRRAIEAAEREIREREAGGGLATRFAAWYDDPTGFNQEVLGRTLWSKQADVCRSVVDTQVTVVPAGRAVGKSYLLAGLVLWWVYTRERSLVVITGPDHRQVVSVLFKELRRAIRPHRDQQGRQWPSIPLAYSHLTKGYASPQRLEIMPGNEWGAIGFAAGTQEGFSGQHQAQMLVIVDEASGIADPIWEAIDGLLPKRLVVSGNPIRYEGRFRELHDLAESGSPNVRTVPISCLDHPHADLETSPVGAVCASWLRQQRELHGAESAWWKSNVLGEFPGQESVRFVPIAWINACDNPAILDDAHWQDYPAGRNRIAVDIGGGVGGDPSVILVRNDKRLLEVFASKEHGVLDDSARRLEPEVVRLRNKWGVLGEDVVFDESGIGRSFGSYLRKHGIEGAVGYFGGGGGGRLYRNRRTACAFAVKKRLDPGRENHIPFYTGGVPQWVMLRHELGMLMGAKMDVVEGTVKEEIEEKASISARLGHSSDYLDALLMSFTYLN